MTNLTNIPQSNPLASYLIHQEAIKAAIETTLKSGWYIHGPQTRLFEKEFAQFLGIQEVIGVGNGTDALALAIRAAGIGDGDAVVTVSNTAVATVAAIEMANAIPVLVDVRKEDGLIDPNCFENVLHTFENIKCIVPVHLFGRPANMPLLHKIAKQNNIIIIEDCAQAHGAKFEGLPVSSWGDLSTYSFYPTKNLGAMGDGGAVVTNEPSLGKNVRLLREYGWGERYISDIKGVNSRLDELQAAILRVKLVFLEEENNRRREIANLYTKGLIGLRDLTLPGNDCSGHVYHQYVIRYPKRDLLRNWLQTHGVNTLIHYPVPIHLQPAYKGRIKYALGGLPITEQICNEIISLPIYPQLTNDQIDFIISAIFEYFSEFE